MSPPTWSVGQVLTAADVNSWFVPLAVAKTSDQSVTSSTTLVNDTALVLAVAANATYWMELYLNYEGGTANASDLKFGWTFPAGLTIRAQPLLVDPAGATRILNTQIQTTVSNAGTQGAGNLSSVGLRGNVTTSGTSGNLQLQWAQNTSNGTATIVHTGSLLVLQRIS